MRVGLLYLGNVRRSTIINNSAIPTERYGYYTIIIYHNKLKGQYWKTQNQ